MQGLEDCAPHMNDYGLRRLAPRLTPGAAYPKARIGPRATRWWKACLANTFLEFLAWQAARDRHQLRHNS